MVETAVIIAVIIGLVEAVKRVGLGAQFAPFLALLFGMTFLYFLGEGEVPMRLFEGIIAGLSAAGLYSSVKAQI